MTRNRPAHFTSVLTLAHGRAEHLRNLVLGLTRQTVPPLELVVGVMQDRPYDLPRTAFPIRQVMVDRDRLPLAAARNAVAEAARGEVLAFLDVDCIPAPTFVADYGARAVAGMGVLMGEVLYLPGGANAPGWTYAGLEAVAEKHSDRRGPPAGEAPDPCEDYRCFWSLNFATSRQDWARSGGFDENYSGYGGEDTDFGKTLASLGIPMWWIRGARTFHQYHPHAMPPIHHLRSVIRNADYFASKWGYRTMEHWLYAFELMGLIRKTERGIEILREVTPEDEDLCRQEAHMPYANTRRVIRMLQERGRREAMDDAEAVARMRSAEARLREPESMPTPGARPGGARAWPDAAAATAAE
jgi:GT2 family glycosyltransferase